MIQILQSHLTELLQFIMPIAMKLSSSPSWQVRLPLLRLRPADIVIVFRARAAGLLAALRVPLLRRPHRPPRRRRRALLDPRRRTSTCVHEVGKHSLATHGSNNYP